MKTVSTFATKTRVFAATALMGVAILFQPAEILAQKAGKVPASTHEASSFTTTASPQLMASFYETEPMKLRLHLANPAGGSVNIAIRNGKGQVVYADSFKGTAYSSILDLSMMTPGSYTLAVGNQQEVVSRSFSVTDQANRTVVAQALEHQPGSELLATIYEMAPMKVKVHVANPSGQKVQMEVQNQENETVLQKTLTGKQVAQILDLAKLTDGSYTIQVYTQRGRVSRTFETATVVSRSFAWEDGGIMVSASTGAN